MTREEVTKHIRESPKNNFLLILPTGFGKTYCALELIENRVKLGLPILIVIPRLFLIENWKKELNKFKLPDVVYCQLEDDLRIPYKPLVPAITEDMEKIGYFPVEDIPATMSFDEELNSLVGQYYYLDDWVLYRKYDALHLNLTNFSHI